MKISILNSVHRISDTRVRRIAESLAEAGHEITLIAPSIADGEISQYDESLQIAFLSLMNQPQGHFQEGRSFAGIIKTILSRFRICAELFSLGGKQRADVYHCNEVDSWAVGILLAIFSKSRVVFDVHEYYPARVTDVLSGGVIGPIAEGFSRFLFNFLALFSDGLIFVNQSLVELYGYHGKHTILRNCVRKKDFYLLKTDEALKTRFQNRIIVLHIGSLREQYGPRVLLDSLAFLDDSKTLFLIIGGAAEDFIAEVEGTGQSDRIRIIDQIPFNELLGYLALADIGISPLQPSDKNTIYSLARKFLEYVAAGIPVIVSDFPEYRALVEKYDLGLVVNPEDPQEIAAAVNRLVEDQQLRVQLGENAARAFEVELNWEMESVILLELYNGLR